MEQVQPGDIVTLVSGGPDMTVIAVQDDVADLGWFTAVGEYRTGTLPLSALVKRRPEPTSSHGRRR